VRQPSEVEVYLPTHPPTQSRVLLKKITVTHLVKKFFAFYGTQGFIIVFTNAHYWSLF